MKSRIAGYLAYFIALFLFTGMSAEAASLQDNKYVTFSPDGKAFSTNAGEQDTAWYGKDDTVSTGITSTFRELKTGEHYYKTARNGIVPIGRWEVKHVPGQCIHNAYPREAYYHGVTYRKKICYSSYYSGWMGYCADCGELVTPMLMYASKDAISSLKDLDLNYDYYYTCPFCTNLEQGRELGLHYCKAISWNKYVISYSPNLGTGYMDDSNHIYNNATEYEGEEVIPQTHLSKNSYTRTGYEFVGWNTKANGTGQFFSDGQEVINLSSEENGFVQLYAQWKVSESTLEINPNGGTYNEKSGISSFRNLYRKTYIADPGKLVAPAGHTVSFDTQGGKPVGSIIQKRSFREWKLEGTFAGKFDLKMNVYTYLGRQGSVDRLTAIYDYGNIVLPNAEKENSSFGGWYYDKECTKPAGAPGDILTPDKDIILYAKWVELTLKSVDNYYTDGGKGAVNLSWLQNDGRSKNYMIYQSRDNSSWTKILGKMDISNDNTKINETYEFTGQAQYFTAPYAGLYSVVAYGAQGGNYGGYSGGYGGKAAGDIWLEKGQTLQIMVGGQNGYNYGASGTYTPGGGYTGINLNNQVVMIAGGGGGATPGSNGGAGGLTTSVIEGNSGQYGSAGGGGGYQGGTAGTYTTHTHAGSCYHYHSGDSTNGGGCYTNFHQVTDNVLCNISYTTLQDVMTCRSCWKGTYTYTSYWEKHDYDVCEGNGERRAWRSYCDYEHTSNGGGDIPSGSHIAQIERTVYDLGCGINQGGVICGMGQGQVLANTPSYGGSNYGNVSLLKNYSNAAGVQGGNGSVTITANSVGYLEVQSLEGVKSTDLAAPDAIAMNQVYKDANPDNENQVIISWEKPVDHGTTYYHRAESYLSGQTTVLSNSNITINTLTSGISGYYYRVDTSSIGNVNASNGTFLKAPGANQKAQVTVSITTDLQYLHISAVDVAGNVSGTIVVAINKKDPDVAWTLETEKIGIRSQESVYPASQPNTYYVRCDEKTPIRLFDTAYVRGDASIEYQITHSIFESQMETKDKAQMDVYTSRSNMTNATVITNADDLQKTITGNPILTDDTYTVTERTNWCKNLKITEDFTVKKEADGKKIRITPIAGAKFKEDTVYSDYAKDLANSIYLIGDCTPPDIDGLEALKDIEVIDRDSSSYNLNFTATDSGSGTKEFYIVVTNKDNGSTQTFTSADKKHISISISEEDALFTGDFTVELHAVDNVGNERVESHDISEFTLRVTLDRVLEPHDPIFRAGESGILKITTTGYADRIEVVFPKEMTALNPDLDTVYVYDPATFIEQEELTFMVPLHTPVDNYTIMVRAYKKDAKLEDYPKLGVIETKGDVLENIQKHLK